MSDQTPPTPDADPNAYPTADVPAEDESSTAAPAPDQWPAPDAAPEAGAYVPPPAYPAAPAYPASAPATYPAAYPAAEPAYPAAVPPPAYPAAGYGAPAAPAPQTSSNAIIALILAIVSWAVCPIIPAIVALVLAASAAKEIAASGGRIQGGGLVTAARIVSWINIGLWAAVLVIGAFFLVLAIVAGGLDNANL